ncbi:hypothetical protein PHYBOEH_004494 [Phytophthora boehmeriae]|uniref:FYVE-type domain-containing protein n=1 Tax=Phytophthora boehmeriae TaxID=109152 RepID=A0A8T1WLK1_9STRA|nr:hypothetical protein PHYBOEH_004494 [Phytophthora boehmeriae]
MTLVDEVYPPRPFRLNVGGANALEMLADQLVAETLVASDDFIARGRLVDKAQWKAVKHRNNMAAYRARKRSSSIFRRDRIASDMTEAVAASPQLPKFLTTNDRNAMAGFPSMTFLDDDGSDDELLDEASYVSSSQQNELEKAIPSGVPMVFCTGIVPGTIEDAALGFFADTEARSRVRNSSTKEVVVDDVRILARIHGPTEDDPFRFLGIKWCAHSTAGAAGHFIKSRDYLVIESTGIALDARGNRFCYMLNHSIEQQEVPDFKKFGHVRMTFSACHIMRPCDTAGQIEIFSRGFMDTNGIIAERMCTYMYCDGLMSVPLTVEDAYAKKLTWLLHAQQNNDSGRLCPPLDISDSCRCCKNKLLTGFAKLLESNAMCYLCRHSICRKCTVKKEVSLDVSGPGQLAKRTMDFCVSCYLEGKNLSAWQVGIALLSAS